MSLYAGAGFLHVGQPANPDLDQAEVQGNLLQLGAVLMLGYRPLPLLQVHLSRNFSIDGWASWSINLENGDYYDRYLAGFSWQF